MLRRRSPRVQCDPAPPGSFLTKGLPQQQSPSKIGPFAVNIRSPDRREFLRLLAGASMAGALPAWLRAAEITPQDLVTISILHTTDLHGHILPTVDYDGRPDLGGARSG